MTFEDWPALTITTNSFDQIMKRIINISFVFILLTGFSLSGQTDTLQTGWPIFKSPTGTIKIGDSDIPPLVLNRNGNGWHTGFQRSGVTKGYVGTGNSGTSFYLTSYADFALRVNGSGNDSFYLSSSGNVGIGTNDPTDLLHLNASNPYLRLQPGINQAGGIRFYESTNELGGYYYSGSQFEVKTFFNRDIALTTPNGGLFVEGTNGNIGIGTTTPNAHLEIKKASSSSQDLLKFTDGNLEIGRINGLGTADGLGLFFAGKTSASGSSMPAMTIAGYANDLSPDDVTDAAISLRAYNAANNGTLSNMPLFKVLNGHSNAALTIDAEGDVGIGISSPAYKLDVNGIIGVKGQRLLDDNGTSLLVGDLAGGDGLRSLTLRAGDQNRMHINTSGNVGVGTSSPSDLLHVSKLSSHTRLRVGNNASFDQLIHFNGAADWSVGIDNSNSNSFTIASTSSLDNNQRFTINSTGDVGIGTMTPGYTLEVKGGPNGTKGINISDVNSRLYFDGRRTLEGHNSLSRLDIAEGFGTTQIFGNVGIGVANPTEKLEVTGNALIDGEVYSKKVRVSTNPGGWPDYVFESDYKLPDFSELEAYIRANKHLPEVPSAKEVEAKGQDVGHVQTILLKKIEEMTLQMIEMNKRLEKLEKENKALKEKKD